MTQSDKRKPPYLVEKKSLLRNPAAWLTAAAAAAAAGYFALAGSSGDSIRYITEKAKTGSLLVTVSADGSLNPVRTVSIGSELSGIVEKVNVDVNDEIKENDVLIELDTENLKRQIDSSQAALAMSRAGLEEAQAQLEESRLKLERLERLNAESGGRLPSRTELESQRAQTAVAEAKAGVQKANIQSAQADLSTARNNLEKALIKSPINGVVLARSVEPGYAVAASLQAVELLSLATDLKRLELRVNIDEADVGVVEQGQKSYFTVSAYPNKTFPAELKKISFGSTETENVVTYTAYLDVENDELLLRPGMTANAVVETARRDSVLLIPNTALRYQPRVAKESSGSSPFIPRHPGPGEGAAGRTAKEDVQYAERTASVYVLENGVPVKKEIKVGLTDGAYTEVLSGPLKPNDEVIVDQAKLTR